MSLLVLLTPVWRWLGGIALVLLTVLGIYAYGHHKGAASNEARWQAAMVAEQTRQAAVRAKALDEAVDRELARAAENDILQKKADSYEEALARRPVADGCRLTERDIIELRKLQGSAAP